MKRRQWFLAISLLMLASFVSVHAQCPVQETTVFYINGVDNTKRETEKSTEILKSELLSNLSVNPDCVMVTYAYNKSETLSKDLVEAAVQKTQELHVGMTPFWRMYFRTTSASANPWFGLLIDELYKKSDATRYVIADQLQAHLDRYREELDQGRQVILVSHSQGNFYANEAWNALTPEEQSQVHIVSVATPAEAVADDGEYTTLTEDGFARWFAFALPANASNGEICPDEWYCHGFREWYLVGQNSHDRIVDAIVSLLAPPAQCLVEGVVKDMFFLNVIVDASVTIQGSYLGLPLSKTYTTDANGHYCIPQNSGVPDGWSHIDISMGNDYIGSRPVYIRNGSTTVAGFPVPVMM